MANSNRKEWRVPCPEECNCRRHVPYARTHGMRNTPTYVSWVLIINRTSNPNNPRFADYGGRGITMCERWRHSFQNFFGDMGKRPDGTSIERRDNNRGYEPSNCYWATKDEQANNRRNNHLLTLNGKTQTMAMWAKELQISYTVLRSRVNRYGWSDEKALTTPVGKPGCYLRNPDSRKNPAS